MTYGHIRDNLLERLRKESETKRKIKLKSELSELSQESWLKNRRMVRLQQEIKSATIAEFYLPDHTDARLF